MYLRHTANLGGPTLPAPISYSPPFPNIRAKRPDLYDVALKAHDAIDKLKWFQDVYRPLSAATADSRLALNSADEVIVIPGPASLENLLGPKVVKAAFKQIGKTLVKDLFSEMKDGKITSFDLAQVITVLDLLWKIKTALTRDDGIRLVNEQNKSRRDEAYRFKLRFFIRLRIAHLSPHADPVILAGRMWDAFWAYRKAEGELWKYQDIEKNLSQGLDPHRRRPQTMNPA